MFMGLTITQGDFKRCMSMNFYFVTISLKTTKFCCKTNKKKYVIESMCMCKYKIQRELILYTCDFIVSFSLNYDYTGLCIAF